MRALLLGVGLTLSLVVSACRGPLGPCTDLDALCQVQGCEAAALDLYCEARVEKGDAEVCAEGIERATEEYPDCAEAWSQGE